MTAQATLNPIDPIGTAFLPASALDVSAESLISAHSYKNAADSHLGTSGGPSWAFGENGSTLTFVPTRDIGILAESLGFFQAKQKNLKAIKLLEQWFAEPDDLGEKFWEEFDKELETNKFNIP
jgi:hypothetical protein